jgi:hypothetical protein
MPISAPRALVAGVELDASGARSADEARICGAVRVDEKRHRQPFRLHVGMTSRSGPAARDHVEPALGRALLALSAASSSATACRRSSKPTRGRPREQATTREVRARRRHRRRPYVARRGLAPGTHPPAPRQSRLGRLRRRPRAARAAPPGPDRRATASRLTRDSNSSSLNVSTTAQLSFAARARLSRSVSVPIPTPVAYLTCRWLRSSSHFNRVSALAQ